MFFLDHSLWRSESSDCMCNLTLGCLNNDTVVMWWFLANTLPTAFTNNSSSLVAEVQVFGPLQGCFMKHVEADINQLCSSGKHLFSGVCWSLAYMCSCSHDAGGHN